MENNHQEKLNQIEAECSEIKRQILQLEFQTKKDMAEYKEESVLRNRQIERHLSHLSKLAGITFEELDAIDDDLEAVWKVRQTSVCRSLVSKSVVKNRVFDPRQATN